MSLEDLSFSFTKIYALLTPDAVLRSFALSQLGGRGQYAAGDDDFLDPHLSPDTDLPPPSSSSFLAELGHSSASPLPPSPLLPGGDNRRYESDKKKGEGGRRGRRGRHDDDDEQHLVCNYAGVWTPASAGGCPNFASWSNNPQYLFACRPGSTVHCVLSQPDPRITGEPSGKGAEIGFVAVTAGSTPAPGGNGGNGGNGGGGGFGGNGGGGSGAQRESVLPGDILLMSPFSDSKTVSSTLRLPTMREQQQQQQSTKEGGGGGGGEDAQLRSEAADRFDSSARGVRFLIVPSTFSPAQLGTQALSLLYLFLLPPTPPLPSVFLCMFALTFELTLPLSTIYYYYL
jgi:hypothetical protein